MTKRPPARVGDQIRDGDTKREGIVTDISGGAYVLRPLYGQGTWTSPDHERLTVTVTREQRARENRM